MSTPNPWPENSAPSEIWPSEVTAQPSTAPAPAPRPQSHAVQPAASAAPKTKVMAVILACFLGGLGMHNFYLGYTRKGVLQLSLTILGSILTVLLVGYLLLMVVMIWVLVDILQIATGSGTMYADADGVPLA